MSLLAMPLIVVNLGAEMVYILHQRLKAQCIAEDKSHMVLNDVVSTWLDNRFIEELFKPQQLYSLTATRQIFERLAHSSIMRLNQSRYAACCRNSTLQALLPLFKQNHFAAWRNFLISWLRASNTRHCAASRHRTFCRSLASAYACVQHTPSHSILPHPPGASKTGHILP